MLDTATSWETLVPGDLPAKRLNLVFPDFNPKEHLASFEFVGFVYMNEMEVAHPRSDLADVSYYLNPLTAQKVVEGKNHYGPLFFIEVRADSIVIEDYCLTGVCHETSMRLLKYLVIDLGLECSWQSYSWYYDSYERSPIAEGTAVELRALFNWFYN